MSGITIAEKITETKTRFWLGDFMMPVFENRTDAMFFEPLLELIHEQAKNLLPSAFAGEQ